MSLSLSAWAALTRGDTANVRAAGDAGAGRFCALAAYEAKATVAAIAIAAKRMDLRMRTSLVERPHQRAPIAGGDSENSSLENV
jgi:hypothetical protein